MYRVGRQAIADHDFVNHLRKCKGGEKAVIAMGDRNIILTIEVVERPAGYGGEKCTGFILNQLSEQEK